MLHVSMFTGHKIPCKNILTPKKIGSRLIREYVCKDCRVLKSSVPKHNRGQYHEGQSNDGYPRRHRLRVAHRKVQAILAIQRHRTTLNFAIGLSLAIGWRRTNDRLLEMMTEDSTLPATGLLPMLLCSHLCSQSLQQRVRKNLLIGELWPSSPALSRILKTSLTPLALDHLLLRHAQIKPSVLVGDPAEDLLFRNVDRIISRDRR